MKYLFFLFVIILVGTVSCTKNKSKTQVISKQDSLKIVNNRIEVPLGEVLIPSAKKAVNNWREYKDVDDFITQFYNISTSEALSNARELSELVVLMKDSIRVDDLKTPSVIARINVLENETLRLADMATIPSIKTSEVKDEVTSILTVYSDLNSKINTLYNASAIQKALEVDTEKPVEELKKDKVIPYKKPSKTIRESTIRKSRLKNKPIIKKN
ncbi:MAG: hypothetical protein R3342_08070 [Lutibacter sp.]|uniref:hypothetical protein n=1 Tax=Lutibacter sp. TaxID=1925666 RepID=UPI00299D40D0|nr:hypothetical protein [Lutibacter sp.]MDX1829486.1 hypothetical protein [Lutibacter sp.]